MTDTAISPLRRRMIEDMTIRQFRPTTQHNYVRFVKEFSIFFGRSPDKAAFEDVRRCQLHLTSRGVSPGSINGAMTALRFFFRVTVQRFDIANHLPLVRQPRRLPVVLSPEEVTRLLEAARGPKYKAALALAYGAGLRVSEIVSLKVSDIDSKRMMTRVEQKGTQGPLCDAVSAPTRVVADLVAGAATRAVVHVNTAQRRHSATSGSTPHDLLPPPPSSKSPSPLPSVLDRPR